MSPLESIVERVASDPEFAQRLAADPTGTIEAEGIEIDQSEVSAFLNVPGASERELAEALQARLSHSGQSVNGGAAGF